MYRTAGHGVTRERNRAMNTLPAICSDLGGCSPLPQNHVSSGRSEASTTSLQGDKLTSRMCRAESPSADRWGHSYPRLRRPHLPHSVPRPRR